MLSNQKASLPIITEPNSMATQTPDQLSLDSLDNRRVANTRVQIDDLTAIAIRSQFDPMVIGGHILLLAEGSDGVERTIGYSSIIAKALLTRMRRK